MSLLQTKRASGVFTKFGPGIYDEFIDPNLKVITTGDFIYKV